MTIFTVENILAQAFQVSDTFPKALGIDGVLSLTLVCRLLARALRAYIESHYAFNGLRVRSSDALRVYHPLRFFRAPSALLNSKFSWPLIELSFSWSFNERIDALLPAGLQYLRLGEGFNQPIDDLPCSLRRLTIGCRFDHPIDHLPPGLTHLYIDDGFFAKPIKQFPPALTHLRLRADFEQTTLPLPPDLKVLVCGCYFSDWDRDLTIAWSELEYQLPPFGPAPDARPRDPTPLMDCLPPKLTDLWLSHGFNGCVDRLPPSLRFLRFGRVFNRPVEKLPVGLRTLLFGGAFDRPIGHLPPSLQNLRFGTNFVKQPPDMFPPAVQHMSVGLISTSFLRALPAGLVSLTLHDRADEGLDFSILPPKLSRLIVTTTPAQCSLDFCTLPAHRSLSLRLHETWIGHLSLPPPDSRCIADISFGAREGTWTHAIYSFSLSLETFSTLIDTVKAFPPSETEAHPNFQICEDRQTFLLADELTEYLRLTRRVLADPLFPMLRIPHEIKMVLYLKRLDSLSRS